MIDGEALANSAMSAEAQLAKTVTLASLQTNGLKGATATKAMSFCVRNSSITAVVCKLC